MTETTHTDAVSLPPDDDFSALRTHILDADSEWWPFAFLRPQQHEHFTTLRCLLLALLYGAPAALAGVVAGSLMGEQVQGVHLVLFPTGVTVLLFAAFRVAVATSWNRRATQLQLLHERRAQWRRSVGK